MPPKRSYFSLLNSWSGLCCLQLGTMIVTDLGKVTCNFCFGFSSRAKYRVAFKRFQNSHTWVPGPLAGGGSTTARGKLRLCPASACQTGLPWCANCQSLPQAELFVRQRERPGLRSPAVAWPPRLSVGRRVQGVPELPGAPQDEAGLPRKFET